jgi:hypothetical protein
MFDNEIDNNEEYYSPLDALNEDDYSSDDGSYDISDDSSSYDGEGSDIECSNCNHSWDLADSSAKDPYICHSCGHDNYIENSEMSSFDDSVFNMDFSEIRGKNFKQSFGKVNRRIASKPTGRRMPIQKGRKPRPSITKAGQYQGRQSQPRMSQPKRAGNNAPSGQPISRPIGTPSFQSSARPQRGGMKKPLNNNIPVKQGKYNLKSGSRKKIANVIVPNDQKVIIEGASKFILSQSSKDEGIKGIQYYKGKKLKPLILTINNTDPTDFVLELFNPSMPLDYLYSTSQNLNSRVKVAGGTTSYSDVLFNILANPVMVVNVQMVTSGSQVANQNNQAIFVTNKNIEGYQKIFPVNIDLQVDNMQVANDIIYFNVFKAINRPFIPDGMDIIRYTILAGMSVTMTFWYTQVSLKKFFYEEAKASKSIL